MIRTILTNVLAGVDPTRELDAACAVARAFGAAIDVLHVRPSIGSELAAMPDVLLMANADRASLERLAEERAARARRAFENWRREQGGAPVDCTWIEEEGFLEDEVVRRGRLADLLVVQAPDPALWETARSFDAAVFGAGRPCLVVPRAATAAHPLGPAVVAWNGSLESTRAVAGAMPLLRAAPSVTVFAAPEHDGDAREGQELARALARHGIAATVAPPPDAGASTGTGTGTALLQVARDVGARLVVMGAYTHSRIRQRLLGGVTRHVLAHATVPLLMAH